MPGVRNWMCIAENVLGLSATAEANSRIKCAGGTMAILLEWASYRDVILFAVSIYGHAVGFTCLVG